MDVDDWGHLDAVAAWSALRSEQVILERDRARYLLEQQLLSRDDLDYTRRRDAYDDALARISNRLTQVRSKLTGGS